MRYQTRQHYLNNCHDGKEMPFHSSLEEQQRIVAKLDAVFDSIDKEINETESKITQSSLLMDSILDSF